MNDKGKIKIYDNFPALSPDETEIVLTRFTGEREWRIYSDNPTYARKYDALLDMTKPTSKGYRDGALVMIDGCLDSDLCTVGIDGKLQYAEKQRADMNDKAGALNFEGVCIDMYVIDGKLLFDGRNVAKALGYSDPLKALHDHVAMKYEWITQDRTWHNLIDEKGLDSLISSSETADASNLKRLIALEVPPTIGNNHSGGSEA